MNSQVVEDLFAELLELAPDQRCQHLESSELPATVKTAAIKLINAFESKSKFLNDDLLTDLARLDPNFFSESHDEPELKVGDHVGRYTIEGVLGEGGMSIVYQARQTTPIKRRVALKLIRPSILTPKTVRRFIQEQQALAAVQHPNIATLFEVGTTQSGHPFAAMELVKGLPITHFCNRHQSHAKFRIELFVKACQGLAQAHRHGIIHRDIKPEHVLVTNRGDMAIPKLIDFGIAKFVDDTTPNQTLTRPGQVLGSPRYMSPEQIEGEEIDERSDVYSAALVLFELLAQSPYRTGNNANMLLSNARTTDIELLSERLRQTRRQSGRSFPKSELHALLGMANRDLNWILEKALAHLPDNRYQTLDLFLNDLKASYFDQPISLRRPNIFFQGWRFLKSKQTPLAIAAAGILVLTSAITFFSWQKSANELSEIKRTNQLNQERNAASNDLIIRLFASNQYQLATENIDSDSIQMYENQYEQIKTRGGPKNHEEKSVYGILAVFYAMSGSFDEADDLLEQVTDEQKRSELRRVREKICENYANNAKQQLATLPTNDKSIEKARQQLVLGRCYIVLSMLKESEKLILEAIEIFDANPQSDCDSLIARNTLAKLYEQSGQTEVRKELLRETYQDYQDDTELLATTRGKVAFAITSKWFFELETDTSKDLNR